MSPFSKQVKNDPMPHSRRRKSKKAPKKPFPPPIHWTYIPWTLGLTIHQLNFLRRNNLDPDHAQIHSHFCKEIGCPIHN